MTTTATATRTDARIDEVVVARLALPDALDAARIAAAAKGHDHPDTRSAWADVEAIGAVIHRRARLLAGKPRGG